MTRHVQLTLDWTQTAKLPEVPTPATATATAEKMQQEPALPGLEAQAAAARGRKSPARLPVPTPLPAAVGLGNFGEDEHGPVRPGRAEVRAITEHHAERLIDLLEQLESVNQRLSRNGTSDRDALVREKDRVQSAYQGGLALYAEDFGQPAANRLEAYVRHQFEKS